MLSLFSCKGWVYLHSCHEILCIADSSSYRPHKLWSFPCPFYWNGRKSLSPSSMVLVNKMPLNDKYIYEEKSPALLHGTACTSSSAFYFYEPLSFGHLYQLLPFLDCSFWQSCGLRFLLKHTPQCLLPFVIFPCHCNHSNRSSKFASTPGKGRCFQLAVSCHSSICVYPSWMKEKAQCRTGMNFLPGEILITGVVFSIPLLAWRAIFAIVVVSSTCPVLQLRAKPIPKWDEWLLLAQVP